MEGEIREGGFLTSQQLTEHRAAASPQCQLKRRCVSNMSAFVLLLMKLHQREFPKAAGKQVNKAGIKLPYQGCSISHNYPRALKNAPSHIYNGSAHRAKPWEGEFWAKAGPSPVLKLTEATQDINTKSTLNPSLNHKISGRVVSTSKAERDFAPQKLQHHPQPSSRAGCTAEIQADAGLAAVCSWVWHSGDTVADICLHR